MAAQGLNVMPSFPFLAIAILPPAFTAKVLPDIPPGKVSCRILIAHGHRFLKKIFLCFSTVSCGRVYPERIFLQKTLPAGLLRQG
ncbi:MAG: hypothetical protein JSU01_09675 [Bacteroidetes bacterium]|nr:hypothetical protein [Bacteroidota bacterium]